jgi:hypothetical protein
MSGALAEAVRALQAKFLKAVARFVKDCAP